MSNKALFNQLELAYAPLTAYEYSTARNDHYIELALEEASLYVIGQRPVITFEKVQINSLDKLEFEIHQKGNPNILKCKLPIIQSVFGANEQDNIAIAFNFLDKSVKGNNKYPLYNIHDFSIYRHKNSENEFLIWFSPEKLLQNWWKGNVDCEIQGDYKTLLKYKVHYVGKATKQSILKRLSGHSTFQDILSLEAPVTEKQLPANEIIILSFKFEENIQLQSFGEDSDIKSMVRAVQGEDYPDQEKVFLDVEKALISAIKPGYNKELFNNYPKSKDGLYNDNYDAISYKFSDPITLTYKEGEISGGDTPYSSDAIIVLNNSNVRLVKNKSKTQ